MATKTGISLRVLSNRLPEMSTGLKSRVQAVTDRTAYRIEARAKAACPVRTGTLRRSIHTLTPTTATQTSLAPANVAVPTGPLPEAGQAFVGVGVAYGRIVEFGSGKRPAKPYLIPALEAESAQYRAEIKALLS